MKDEPAPRAFIRNLHVAFGGRFLAKKVFVDMHIKQCVTRM